MAITQYPVIGGLLLGLLLAGRPELQGQNSPFDSVHSQEASLILERVDCFTDRSLYITGELIRFRAMVQFEGPSDRVPWSRVLYVDLLTAKGERITEGKYEIVDRSASGEIRIPADLLSGLYYLRCYTRWMRNRGPESYGYIPLRMVNPILSEWENPVTIAEAGASIRARNARSPILEFKAHPSFYGRGDSVTLQLQVTGDGLPETFKGCLTVVPGIARPADHAWEVLTGNGEEHPPEPFQLSFLPDRYGPSISGTMVDADGAGEAFHDSRVHFTLMGATPAYYVGTPDISGKFTVALPFRSGGMELFVQPESPDRESVEVKIDQDFDPRHLQFRDTSFTLCEQERQMATIMARNVQLSGIYREPGSTRDEGTRGDTIPFYGTPTFSLDMDRYVLLPTLEEVLLNLVSGVTPVTRKNRTTLQIDSENPAFSLFEPLVMVDQVPVFDMEKFMSVSSSKIRRIDVIEDVYVIGDVRFGGLINIQSREKDMAGIDLPLNAFFIDYMAITPEEQATQFTEVQDGRIPDTRNTLLWLPDLPMEKGVNASIAFVAPDYPGQYTVLFRGMGPAGELIIAETTFEILH
jgi:hypothetical protein